MHYLDDHRPAGTLPNVVSLIDVFLFILLAQMAGTAGTSPELPVELAQVRTAAPADERPAELLRVIVTDAGEYRVDGAALNAAEMRSRIQRLSSRTRVVVEADRDARHSAVAQVLSAAHEAELRCVVRVQEEPAP